MIQERKQERQKMGRKIIPLGHIFYPPNMGENVEAGMLNDVIYTNTPTLLHSPTFFTYLLYNKDILIYINYIFHHPLFLSNQTKKFSTLPFFHLFNQIHSNQIHMRENQIFFIFLLFYPAINFSSFHFSNQTNP